MPTLSMESVEKAATPETAVTVAVPESVAERGVGEMVMVTLAAELVTVLPNGSWTATWMAGAMAMPAVELVGCTANASLEAEAGEMLKAVEVAPDSVPEAAVSV